MNRRGVLALGVIGGLSVVAPASADATTDANAAIARKFADAAWVTGNIGALSDVVSPDVTSGTFNAAPGIDALGKRITQARQLIDITATKAAYTVADVIAQDDMVVARVDVAGTSRSGKNVGSNLFIQVQIEAGLIVKEWSAIDMESLNGF